MPIATSPIKHKPRVSRASLLRLALLLSRVAVALALVVVLLGGWTRLNDAGLSCPDWPGCYGEIFLPGNASGLALAQSRFPDSPLDLGRSQIEMSHRYLAGSLGLVVAALAIIAWPLRTHANYPVWLSTALLGLVTLQAVFGMWTVTLKLLPQVVTLHLLGGMLTLALLWRLQQRLQLLVSDAAVLGRSRYQAGITLGLLLLFIQIGLGGWTSANYAGWSCSDWLLCDKNQTQRLDFTAGFSLPPVAQTNQHSSYQGGKLPREARAAIQMTHRGSGLVLAVYLLGLSAWLCACAALRRATGLVLFLLIVQMLLGGLSVAFGLPLWLAFAHHTGAVLLLLALVRLYAHAGVIIKENEHGQTQGAG